MNYAERCRAGLGSRGVAQRSAFRRLADICRSRAARRLRTCRLDLGSAAWEPIEFGEPLSADSQNSRVYSLRRIGEDSQHLLSYHPLVVGHLVLFNNQSQIFAFDLKTGKPAWPRKTNPAVRFSKTKRRPSRVAE